MEKSRIGDRFEADLLRNSNFHQRFLAESLWTVEHLRRRRHGTIYLWDEVSPAEVSHNVCTAEGLNLLLDVMFHGIAAIGTWYVAIFESNTVPTDGTTYAVPVYTESTAYDEATRPAFDEAAASGKAITNTASKATFTMNATKTIYGGSLVSESTKGDTAAAGAKLYCASQFTTQKDVVASDVLKITVTITAADA